MSLTPPTNTSNIHIHIMLDIYSIYLNLSKFFYAYDKSTDFYLQLLELWTGEHTAKSI